MSNSAISHSGSRWKISNASIDDIPEIQELFELVFGQEVDSSFWNWKYGENRGLAVVAREGDLIVAHYAGLKRDIIWEGEQIPSIQCVDTMVRSMGRGTLAKRGPYFLTAFSFLDQYVGFNRPYLFGFGFPNERVMNLGEKLGIQSDVGKIVEPMWKSVCWGDDDFHLIDVNTVNFTTLLNDLWAQMKLKFPGLALCVRDSETLMHRYMKHPTHQYTFHIVKRNNEEKPLGAYVLRNEGPRMLLLDLIGDPADFPYLVACARKETSLQGVPTMSAWITEPHLEMLGNEYETVEDPGVRIPTSSCTDGPLPGALRNRWWLMAGDTDFK